MKLPLLAILLLGWPILAFSQTKTVTVKAGNLMDVGLLPYAINGTQLAESPIARIDATTVAVTNLHVTTLLSGPTIAGKQAAFVTGLGHTNIANVYSNNIVAGANVTITAGAYGQLTIASTGGGGGGTVGSMINTGANVVGNLPRASDTTPTNYVPSVVIVDVSGNVTGVNSIVMGGTNIIGAIAGKQPVITTGLGLTNNGANMYSNNVAAGSNMTITEGANGLLTFSSAGAGTGGTVGTMINTGNNVVGNVPIASDTSPTNYVPSLMVIDGSGNVTGAISVTLGTTNVAGALALKAPINSPSFSGTVTMPTPFTLGAVSVTPTGTELNFVDGATSSIQDQLNARALAATTMTIAGTANEITSSAGAQSLAANRTWTLSLPTALTFTGKTITGGTINGATVGLIASGFNGNLATTDDTLQEVAQKLDDLSISGGGNWTASGTTNSTLPGIASVHSLVVTNSITATTFNTTTNNIGTLNITNPVTNVKFALTISPGGADDTWAGNSFSGLNNTGGVTQWDAVYLNGSSQWARAYSTNVAGFYPARGLVTATVSTGNATVVIEDGVVRNDAWNWTPGGNIYLSTTAGEVTQTAPSTTGYIVHILGYAINADTMRVKISSDYGTAP